MKEKKRKNKKSLWTEIILLSLSIFLIWSMKNEFLITISIIVLFIACFFFEYHKGELSLLFIGIITGIIIELGGSLIYKLQYWIVGSFFGIPLWLPLLWGYGFIFIRRIGNIVVKD
jgi:hypothetical protein